ncbi:anti-sigma factor RsbA family regulatory protein [Actinoplanes sp. CA-030573]|uniref:anti-sigma factor RsbA family regulatory protein n=1 Tax=Actinoplanes sp. CA-030573 TaxID=3239898 RepID=UPI003D8C624A
MTVFDHPALLYHDTGELLATAVPFVRTAVAAGDPVLVALPTGNLGLVRDALDDDDRVRFADITATGRNPARLLPQVLLPFADAHPGTRVTVVGEPVWPGRTPVERWACAEHEALLNAAFEGRRAAFLCPYDAARLDDEAIADAWRTHPVMIDAGERIPSDEYDDPVRTAESVNRPLPPPPAGAAVLRYARLPDLPGVRAFVRRYATGRLPGERAGELVLAVHELAANTIKHAGGPGTVTVWIEEGMLACQVDDGGHIADPLAGRVPPPPSSPSGRGLLMVNELCDLVRMRTGPGGTTIRMHMALPPAGSAPAQ